MKKILIAAAALLCSATLAGAQCGSQTTYTPPGLAPIADFQVVGCLDYPVQFQAIARSQPLVIGGWAIETRSGLQPSTQRVGDINVAIVDAVTGADFTSSITSVRLTGSANARPDVAAYLSPTYPAVGPNAGFSLTVTGLPPPGTYTVMVLIDTYDGAGRIIYRVLMRTIVVTP